MPPSAKSSGPLVDVPVAFGSKADLDPAFGLDKQERHLRAFYRQDVVDEALGIVAVGPCLLQHAPRDDHRPHKPIMLELNPFEGTPHQAETLQAAIDAPPSNRDDFDDPTACGGAFAWSVLVAEE